MRIITGSARGRRLRSLEGNDVRPTTDMVKEAVFSAIQFQIEERRVLDLFAGSGQIGLEAVSRGASEAVFVDKSPASINVIKSNIAACGFEDSCRVIRSDALSYLSSCAEMFDIVFADPPYGVYDMGEILEQAARITEKSGVIIAETSSKEQLPDLLLGGAFEVKKVYNHGKIKVTMYCHVR
ncbi:MAG: 16S rRNA (guanine(966)-N(2))-methyltransferase RsmD [Oscillospiraceae bacterium]|nr:16S rRNA (guanine(966)-N(2))-methyltransferase RsmD [Oscillospiraceae bacterium]